MIKNKWIKIGVLLVLIIAVLILIYQIIYYDENSLPALIGICLVVISLVLSLFKLTFSK